jgi:hypothetical protein
MMVRHEAARLERDHPTAWAAGVDLATSVTAG